MIKKYRKKPVVVEAVLLSDKNIDEVLEWINEDKKIAYRSQLKTGDAILINTLEGSRFARTGRNWIIKGINGKFYLCEHTIFLKTYEPMKSEE